MDEEIIQNNLIIDDISINITVAAINIVVGGGNRRHNDDYLNNNNYLNIDPKLTHCGIKLSFQKAVACNILYLPVVKNVLFENLYTENKTEIDEIKQNIAQFPNLESIKTIETVNEKGKSNNKTMKILEESFDKIENKKFDKIDEKVISPSPSKPYYQSSGKEIKSNIKLKNFKCIHEAFCDKPVNDRCCHND